MPFPVDIKWVHDTESKLGVKFPAGFVTEMVTINGGTVQTTIDHFDLLPFLDATDRKTIRRTFGIMVRETAVARTSCHGFPEHGVAIGANGGGDFLILVPMEDHRDTLRHSVYWWDHETGDVDRIADDFGDLPKT